MGPSSNDTDTFDPGELDKDTFSFFQRTTCGAVAGLVEHVGMFPVDTIKTNQQTGLGNNISKSRGLIKYWFSGPAWRGVSILVPGVTVAHAAQFPTVEFVTEWAENKNMVINPSLLGGVVGALPHDLIMNPCNVIKQRMQQCNSIYKNPVQCASSLYRSQGLRPFYQSFPTQYVISGCMLGSYYYLYNDLLRTYFNKCISNPLYDDMTADSHIQSSLPIISFTFRSIIATIVAVTITQPLDNVVTRINTGYRGSIETCTPQKQVCSLEKTKTSCASSRPSPSSQILNSKAALRSSLPLNCPRPQVQGVRQLQVQPTKVSQKLTARQVISQMYQEGIFKSSLQGYKMRLFYVVPANFLTWGTYEVLKSLWLETN